MSRRIFAALAPLVLAAILVAPAGALAKWRGISEAESRIVFAGAELEAYRVAFHYRPFVESGYRWEGYQARWRTGGRSVPVLWVHLQILEPGYFFPGRLQTELEGLAKRVTWFRDKAFSANETGVAATAPGPADFLVFTAGVFRCAAFSIFADDGSGSDPDNAGNMRMIGFYCPTSGSVDGAAVKAVLARIGIRGIAVPARRDARPSDSQGALAGLVKAGDIRGLRLAVAGGLDPDTPIAFRHPSYARGREIRRPIVVAASLFGHTEMVAFLLNQGASTAGAASAAICAAIAFDRRDIVDALVKKDPALADYPSCGPGGTEPAIEVARRLGREAIAAQLLQAGQR